MQDEGAEAGYFLLHPSHLITLYKEDSGEDYLPFAVSGLHHSEFLAVFA